jgi:hypothetical protein
MAKTTKKAFAGITSKAPTVKKTATSNPKKPTTNKTGLVSFGYGKYGQARTEYEKAKRGGAKKTASKLAPDEKTVVSVNTRTGSMFNSRSNVTEVASRAADRKAIAQRILNDKSKNVTRAKIAEMNAKKKATSKKTGPSNASKVKKFFADKPKYTSEQIVENKKLQAQIDAAAKKKKKK